VAELVTDASVVMAWLLDDEQGASFEDAAASLRTEGAIVPRHWHYEVRNALMMAVRRNRLSRAGAIARIDSLARLNVSTDLSADLDATTILGFEHDLTFYDALYLELAIRRQLPLATLDNDLQRAAEARGVDIAGA